MLINTRVQKLVGGTFVERLGINLVSLTEMARLLFHKNPAKLRLIRSTRIGRRSMVTADELFILHSLTESMRERSGDIAEVGVYHGSTAKVICDAKGDKTLHLCDTFTGLPEPSVEDKGVQGEGRFACSQQSIERYLSDFNNVSFHKGYCPDSVRGVLDDRRFCLVHLDVDVYESTKDCLEYFFPRLIAGGVLISHDFSILSAVRQAFTEFTADIPENVIELPTTQCMLVKT